MERTHIFNVFFFKSGLLPKSEHVAKFARLAFSDLCVNMFKMIVAANKNEPTTLSCLWAKVHQILRLCKGYLVVYYLFSVCLFVACFDIRARMSSDYQK